MIHSVVGFEKVWGKNATFVQKSMAQFLHAIERAFGFEFVADTRKIPFGELELLDLFEIAAALKKHGVMGDVSRASRELPDEPPLFGWRASFAKNDSAGGASATSERNALAATLAECLERYLWRFDDSFFEKSFHGTNAEASLRGAIALSRFAGFSEGQRHAHKELRMTPEQSFHWVRAYSYASQKYIYIPAQTITGIHQKGEPLIRPYITTGLATGVTKEQALLGGALEVIERDAFIIMWLNQLTLPRIHLDHLTAHEPDLKTLLDRVRRYRLSVDAVRLLTDAPAHVVLAIVRDETGANTPIAVGMSARTRLADAVSHALTEALRIRVNIRSRWLHTMDPTTIIPKKIHHFERAVYWLTAERAKRLAFLTDGPIEAFKKSAWDDDTPAEQLERIIAWCKTRGYEFASVDMGRSKKNPTKWVVENIVIPELQPMHINERFQCISGPRLREIPLQFGYTPREIPFTEEPHPFA